MKSIKFPWAPGSWRELLADSMTDIDEVLDLAGIGRKSAGLGPGKLRETHGFAFRVPRAFAKRIEYGNPEDPLLRQILPLPAESRSQPGFDKNPLREDGGLILRKYSGRALLLLTSACPIHCRYCFRRHYDFDGGDRLSVELEQLKNDPSLRELILSGGDPLMLSDSNLLSILEKASSLPSLKRLRIHTRMPVILPQRIDTLFMAVLRKWKLPLVIVLHINHAREISPDFQLAAGALRSIGIHLLNQAVLLSGVNDDLKTQVELAESLFESGVLPYYLHMLDRVEGASHFEVPESEARNLFAEMSRELPGYLLPRLVREEPGKISKTLMCPDENLVNS